MNLSCMRNYVLVLFWMFCIVQSYGQAVDFYAKDSLLLASVKKMPFTLDTVSTCTLSLELPFTTIQVEDVRFDTSQIAIKPVLKTFNLRSGVENYKVSSRGAMDISLAAYFNHYYSNNLAKGGNAKLVCFLQKLACKRKDTITEENYGESTFGEIAIAAEVFLYTGNKYYAAFKIDTTLMNWVSLKKKEFALGMRDLLLMPALEALENKINRADWNITNTKRAFTKEEVYNHYYEERFKIPILYQPYKKGIYKKYADFTNNAPPIAGISVEKGKHNSIILKDSSGNDLSSIKKVGYCDGKACWLLYKGYYHPLIRSGNCFYFFIDIYGLRILEVFDFNRKDYDG